MVRYLDEKTFFFLNNDFAKSYSLFNSKGSTSFSWFLFARNGGVWFRAQPGPCHILLLIKNIKHTLIIKLIA